MTDSDKDFDSFIKKVQPAQEHAAQVDWNKQREDWLNCLNSLYETVEHYLDKYIKSGEIKSEYADIRLTEDFIGSYTARQMTLNIGSQKVILKPVGTLLIGSKGRVDVLGPRGQARFVLVRRNATRSVVRVTIISGNRPPPPPTASEEGDDWVWKIATVVPPISYLELTKESLFQTIIDISNA